MRVADAQVKEMPSDTLAYRLEAEFLDHGGHLQHSPSKLLADVPSEIRRLPGHSFDGCRVDFDHDRATDDFDPERHLVKNRGQAVYPAGPDVVQCYSAPVGHGHHRTQQAANQYSNPSGSVGRIEHLANAEGPAAGGRLELCSCVA